MNIPPNVQFLFETYPALSSPQATHSLIQLFIQPGLNPWRLCRQDDEQCQKLVFALFTQFPELYPLFLGI